MTSASSYPKRLIEVDLPIKKIGEHARREKSIRQGHISTLHIWWARKPLAVCRAIICASLWPDPADPLCPESFKDEAKKQMSHFWNKVDATARDVDDPLELRKALLDFISDFSNWDNSSEQRYLTTARHLTQSAHEGLGGESGTKPLVVDPFAGGGSIPFEALRVGADAYASDLNPVAVLLNKTIIEYIPKYGQKLSDEVKKWGRWVKEEAEKELAEYYPKDHDGSIPIAYVWARTIQCEGPGCGAEVPLMTSLCLSKGGREDAIIRLLPNPKSKKILFEIVLSPDKKENTFGTVKGGSVTCPICGFTTPVSAIRKQLSGRHGGSADAVLLAVRKNDLKTGRRMYRLPTNEDIIAINSAKQKLLDYENLSINNLSLIPDENLPNEGALGFRVQKYGITKWRELFSPRQLLSLIIFSEKIRSVKDKIGEKNDDEFAIAIQSCLALNLDRLADFNSSLCILNATGGRGVVHTFGRQTINMVWNFMETNPFNEVGANWDAGIDAFIDTITNEKVIQNIGIISLSSATSHPLPNDVASALISDPPYYDNVPYGDLSDFFYVWLKRTLIQNPNFTQNLVPKDNECIMDKSKGKDSDYFEKIMLKAMIEGRRVLKFDGIGVIFYAHKSTEGWETQLKAMIDAGWIITGSWPIDSERPGRLRAQNSAALASSIQLICRPRKNSDGQLCSDDIGEWSDILSELPQRIHEWMPRLKQENVVGADAIFACLGPALEIYSRYSRVEKVSGEQVHLNEYLEKVWEAVEKEALALIFEGADAIGFEEDARLTAMWLWTLKSTENGEIKDEISTTIEEIDTDSEDDANDIKSKSVKITGYALEYDSARKISQGLGAHLEEMPNLIEIKKGNARLLSVNERASYLFGKQALTQQRKPKKRDAQLTLFPGENEIEESVSASMLGELSSIGKTNLDRVHQSMLLFGKSQNDGLKKFLVEDGIGKDPLFWKLAQALAALYPTGTDEKRWVEGVLARKKGLGL